MVPVILRTGIVPAYIIRGEESLLFEVSRTEAESRDYSRFDQFVEQLNIAKKHGREKIAIAFYVEQNKWIEIPEVCEYIRHMFKICPYLPYFLYPDTKTGIALLRSSASSASGIDNDLFRKAVAEAASAIEAYGAQINDLTNAKRIISRYGMRYV